MIFRLGEPEITNKLVLDGDSMSTAGGLKVF